MFAKLLKLLLAGIVAILVPDDNPIPPPWYTEAEEVVSSPSQFFGPSSAVAAAVRPSYNSGLPPNFTMHEYLVHLVYEMDAFWSPIMVQGGYQDPAVTYSFPALGEPIRTKCTVPDALLKPAQAFYCQVDDQIVVTLEMAKQLWEGTLRSNNDPPLQYSAGDFSVAVVIAHEFAHNLQTEIGWIDHTGYKTTSRSIELNADCLSGVWANSAYTKNRLDSDDIQEAMRTLADVGQDMTAPEPSHGSPKERTDAFMLGYNSGLAPSCDHYLKAVY
ncbi:neutral zinc metallopeptidase [Planococcus sp. FY231025]|uniref:neutral zinc metallopeptidase n=1 Tax=Planococcus sp. FY231025 TaxID=3455699 RepID=UPI003F92664A